MTTAEKTIAMAVLLTVWAGSSPAAEQPVVSIESSVFTNYSSRGGLLTDGPVHQNSVTVLWRGAHLNLWTNSDLNWANGQRGKVNEVDFDAGFDRSWKNAGFTGGVILYSFPNTPDIVTTELYAGAMLLTAPLHPSLRVYFDVDDIRGTYVTFDVSHSVSMPKLRPRVLWSVDLAAGAGWGSSGFSGSNFGVFRKGVIDFHPSLAVPVSFGKRWRVTPLITYSVPACKELGDSGVPVARGFGAGVKVGFTL